MPTPRSAVPAAAAALLLAIAATRAAAGPCLACTAGGFPYVLGWRDDRALSPPGVLAVHPRIDVEGTLVAVVYEDRSSGDGDIALATSRDGGCSFAIRALTSGPSDDRAPDVAVHDLAGVIVVVFNRDGAIHAVASGDGGQTFWAAAAIDPLAPLDPTSRPRVAAVPAGATVHVHAVWAEANRLRYARNLDRGSAGGWQAGPPLSDLFPAYLSFGAPDVAADSRSLDPALHSAVTVVATPELPASGSKQVAVVRSNDSGTTFYGDPTDPATRDRLRVVSDPRPPDPLHGAVAPEVDASDDGSGAFVNWTVVAWSDSRSGSPECASDARAEEGATPTLVADWNDPPASGDLPFGEPGEVAAVSIIPNPLARPPLPEVTLFDYRGMAPDGTEIGVLRGHLDAAATPTIAVTCAAAPLTGLFPARTAGFVSRPSAAADEDLSDAYLVWADTRDGGSRIYWKRSDGITQAPAPVVASPGDCLAGGGIEVSWTPPAAPPSCDVDHYRIDYGTQPGVYGASADAPGGSRLSLTGLLPLTRYYLRVTTVDEACNERAAIEVSAVTPDCTGVVRCPNPVGNTLQATRATRDVVLVWAAPPGDASHDLATSYDVYRSTGSPALGYGRIAAPATTTARDVNAVPPGPSTLHFYRVVARNSCGTSGDVPPP